MASILVEYRCHVRLIPRLEWRGHLISSIKEIYLRVLHRCPWWFKWPTEGLTSFKRTTLQGTQVTSSRTGSTKQWTCSDRRTFDLSTPLIQIPWIVTCGLERWREQHLIMEHCPFGSFLRMHWHTWYIRRSLDTRRSLFRFSESKKREVNTYCISLLNFFSQLKIVSIYLPHPVGSELNSHRWFGKWKNFALRVINERFKILRFCLNCRFPCLEAVSSLLGWESNDVRTL